MSLSFGSIPRNLCIAYPSVRHVPSWFPGADWKRKVPMYRKSLQLMIHEPYEWAKGKMVCEVAPLYRLISPTKLSVVGRWNVSPLLLVYVPSRSVGDSRTILCSEIGRGWNLWRFVYNSTLHMNSAKPPHLKTSDLSRWSRYRQWNST